MKANLTKFHLHGILNGMHTNEVMEFSDWDAACAWAAAVTMDLDNSYVVLEMKNLETDEIAFF